MKTIVTETALETKFWSVAIPYRSHALLNNAFLFPLNISFIRFKTVFFSEIDLLFPETEAPNLIQPKG